MAKKEIPVDEKLKELCVLQHLDSSLDDIQILKGELPAEVQDLEDVVAGIDKRIEKIEQKIADFDSDIASHNTNIKEAEALVAKYTKQLDDVKNNREYDALTKELELQQLEMELSEKRKRDITVQIDSNKLLLDTAKEKRAIKQQNLDSKKSELEVIIKKTEKEEKSLITQVDKQRKKIEDRYLRAYDRIRSTYRNGLAVVTVERDACGGCFNKIPPQEQLEINLMNKVLVCEHCGRIFVDQALYEEVTGS